MNVTVELVTLNVLLASDALVLIYMYAAPLRLFHKCRVAGIPVHALLAL